MRPSTLINGYIAQWLERLTADQQVPGSNPGVPFGRISRRNVGSRFDNDQSVPHDVIL